MKKTRIPWRDHARVMVDSDPKTFRKRTGQQKLLLKQQAFNQGAETERLVKLIIRALNKAFDPSTLEGRVAISGWYNRLGPRAGDVIRLERQWHKREVEASRLLTDLELSWRRFDRYERSLMRGIREDRRKFHDNLAAALNDIEEGLFTPRLETRPGDKQQ